LSKEARGTRGSLTTRKTNVASLCGAILNKKTCSMAQSFPRLLIQFTGIAKLHFGQPVAAFAFFSSAYLGY
jgi:hypothetical protein